MTQHGAAADTQQIITDLERKLAGSVAQQAAATEVLQIINGSGGDLTPVLDVMVTKAAELCDATGGGLYLVEGDKTLDYGGTTSRTGAAPSKLMGVPLASLLGPNPQDRPFVHVVDLKATKAYRNGCRLSSRASRAVCGHGLACLSSTTVLSSRYSPFFARNYVSPIEIELKAA